MKTIHIYLFSICLVILSCTKSKTDYEAEINTEVTEHSEFKEAALIKTEGYNISIEALSGIFYKGYNQIRLKLSNTQTNENVNPSSVTFLPVLTNADGSKSSGPHSYNLNNKTGDKYFAGYSVFTSESTTTASWEFYISFTVNNKTYAVKQAVSVKPQTNKNLNMTAFAGNDGEQYIIALVSPQKPKVAENKLVAGIYKYNKPATAIGTFPDPSQFSYTEVKNYKLLLDPRMPEPSMGNHSSPNNKDLMPKGDGLYHGVVNYTMTGNWTLNFIMMNENGKIIKGTEVPKDFTPGVEGVKSELYIDILF